MRDCLVALVILLTATRIAASDCLPVADAKQHVGETKCVTGKVLPLNSRPKPVPFLDFWEGQMACPFTVVVFPSDLKDVGDVRRLTGHVIEIRGPVKLYGGRAEIILNRVGQVSGGATLIPPMPKNYDVEKQGHYSAGRMRPTNKPKKTKQRPSPGATYENEADASEELPQ